MFSAIFTCTVSATIVAAGFRVGGTTALINAIADFQGDIVWNIPLFLVESS
jgi:hypothetical protein